MVNIDTGGVDQGDYDCIFGRNGVRRRVMDGLWLCIRTMAMPKEIRMSIHTVIRKLHAIKDSRHFTWEHPVHITSTPAPGCQNLLALAMIRKRQILIEE